MGITIHYRGTMDDPQLIEEMEDRIVDLAFALGGQATVWRSYADHDPRRMVRGVMLNMAPGQETFSLLISPEGHLTPLWQIEAAERAPFDEPPYCFVKTQFGSIRRHVSIVHILDAIRQKYFSGLQVTDEGEYYESRDTQTLLRKKQQIDNALNAMTEGLREHGLSDEAAEDPAIVASRIERVAKLVHQKILTSPAPEPVDRKDIDDEPAWNEPSLEEGVEQMDSMRRKNDSRNERMIRRIAEGKASGLTAEDAFRQGLEEEGLSVPVTDSTTPDEPELDFTDGPMDIEEPWEHSTSFDFADGDSDEMGGGGDRHPAVLQAQEFLLELMNLRNDASSPGDFTSVAQRAATNIVGGLVQATSGHWDTRCSRALAITQLKRALTGHAFARGAVTAMRSSQDVTGETADRLWTALDAILKTIHELTTEAWDEPPF